MAAPYTPYSKTIRRVRPGTNQAWFSILASGTNQKPPYTNTAYEVEIQRFLKDPGDEDVTSSTGWDFPHPDAVTEATNNARAKFVSNLGDSSSFGATLTAERKETYGMLKSAVVNTLLAARAVKSGKLVEAARIMGVAPPIERKQVIVKYNRRTGRKKKTTRQALVLPSGRTVAKSAANKWLWFSYGVSPLMIDAYNAVDVLQREAPNKKVEGWGKSTTHSVGWDGPGYSYKYETICKVKCSAYVRVSNPNLWLANQYGLVNPLQWANEGIPFSFVVDWFSNLSQVILQMTDFVGLEIADPITSTKSIVTTTVLFFGTETAKERIVLSRALVLPEAKLRFAYERFEWKRGANAISLLVGFLKKNQ